MVANKWIAGAGTRALSPEMIKGAIDDCSQELPKEDMTLVCLDQNTLSSPNALHLPQEDCLRLPFVRLETSASQMRRAFEDPSVKCALVYSSDEVSACNVAAALKRDNPHKLVYLVVESLTPEVYQRAEAALLDGCIQAGSFYKELLKRHIKAPVAQNEIKETESKSPDESSIGKTAQNVGTSCCADTVPFEVYAADALMADVSMELLEEPPLFLVREEPTKMDEAQDPKKAMGEKPLAQRAFYLPVIGASGGAGASTIAFLSALCSAQFGCKTLLIDFDLQFGDMVLYTRSDQVITLDELLDNPRRVREIEPGPEGFVLVGACALPEQSEQVLEAMERIFDEAASCFDVIVSNGPFLWNEQQIVLLERAGKILFVVDHRLGAARAAQKAFDLCLRCGLASSPFLFLLNKCGKQASLSSLDITCAVQGATCKELPDGGRMVKEYLEAQQAADLLDDGNPFAIALRDELMDVLPGCSVLKGLERSRRAPFSLFSRKKRKEE